VCNYAVSTGNSLFFAVAISTNNMQISNYQFGVSVFPKNATSLDSEHFITIYTSSGSCPVTMCANSQNPFNVGCGYDHTLGFGNLATVSDVMSITYPNVADGVYYIQVQGPTTGTNGSVVIEFDIEIDNGVLNLSRYVPVITVLLFCFVFAMLVLIIFLWKKKHGGWLHEDRLPTKNPSTVTQALSNQSLLISSPSLSSSEFKRTDSLVDVVNLFREQTATINKLTLNATGLNPEVAPEINLERGNSKRMIVEEVKKEEKVKKEEEKQSSKKKRRRF